MKIVLGCMVLLIGSIAQAKTVCEIIQTSNSHKIFSGEVPIGSEAMLLKADGALVRNFNLGQAYRGADAKSLDQSLLISIVSEGNGRRTMYIGTLGVTESGVTLPTEAMVMGSAFEPLYLISPPKDLMIHCADYGKR